MDLMALLKKAGFKGQGLKMAYAIAMAESGGNAGAHNPDASTGDNSYGLFQINMLGAMGPERRRQYGLSSNDDLFDALTNAKIAYKMSNGGANWGPWSTYGSGAYKSYYGGSGAAVSQDSTSAYTSTGAAVPKLSSAELAEQYGFVSGLLNSIPELKKLFQQAVSGTWSADKFQAKLRNTKWWKTHGKDEREYLISLKSDPATAKQTYQQARTKVIQLASQMGMEVNGAVKKYIDAATYNMVAKGWDEGQLRYYLGAYVSFPKEHLQGEGGEAINELRQYAYSMGVNLADSWYTARARTVLRGKGTLQDYKSEIMNKAKAAFPQWNKQIEAGQSVADIAQPYMQSMSQILELPSGSINLFDKTVKKALSYTNPGTLQKEAKPLWQFENELRSDPRWKKTKNAQDSLFQVGHQVLADFGFKY